MSISYEVYQLNNETGVKIMIHFNQIPNRLLYSPMYPRPIYIQYILAFHCSKQWRSSSLVTHFSNFAVFSFTHSTNWKCIPFDAIFTLENRQESHEARSGEYGGCSSAEMGLFTKYCFTSKVYHTFHSRRNNDEGTGK